MKILLIQGGWSSERNVSLKSGAVVEKALINLGHHVTPFDPASSLDGILTAAEGADFAFIALHGSPGEDGIIQAMLESVGCPYQGSGPAGSYLALNKAAAKELFRHRGLATPDWQLLTHRPEKGWRPPFTFPLFIKSNKGGSSLDMERVATPADMEGALDRLFAKGGEFIVEPAIEGIEATCGVLGCPGGGEEALPPLLIRPLHPDSGGLFFDYSSKYTPGAAEEICPAPLPESVNAAIQKAALTAHRALGLCDYSRSDFIVQENGEPMLLEVNTLPGMTATSLLPQEAAAIGLSFEQLVERLIALGLTRKRSA